MRDTIGCADAVRCLLELGRERGEARGGSRRGELEQLRELDDGGAGDDAVAEALWRDFFFFCKSATGGREVEQEKKSGNFSKKNSNHPKSIFLRVFKKRTLLISSLSSGAGGGDLSDTTCARACLRSTMTSIFRVCLLLSENRIVD